MAQPTPPFTLNMIPGSRIRMDKYNIGPEGIQINCGTPSDGPGNKSQYVIVDKTQIKMKVWPGAHPFIGGATNAGTKKIDLICKAK